MIRISQSRESNCRTNTKLERRPQHTTAFIKKINKKANMTLDFKNYHAAIFDQSIHLLVTKPGHGAMPINLYKTILNSITLRVNVNVSLVETENNKSKNDIAVQSSKAISTSFAMKTAKIAQLSWGSMTVRRRTKEVN